MISLTSKLEFLTKCEKKTPSSKFSTHSQTSKNAVTCDRAKNGYKSDTNIVRKRRAIGTLESIPTVGECASCGDFNILHTILIYKRPRQVCKKCYGKYLRTYGERPGSAA